VTPWQAAEIRHALCHTHGEYESMELLMALDQTLQKDDEYLILMAAADQSRERKGVR
jgi:hypothetical protein